MQGVITHVSDLKRRTAWTTTLKKVPYVYTYDPSLPRILDIHTLFFRSFHKLSTTVGPSSSESIRIQPRYSKAITVVSRQ